MKNKRWFRSRARKLYHQDGQIEIDSDARVSMGDDNGAYVQAWVWVPLNEEEDARSNGSPLGRDSISAKLPSA